MFVVTIGNESIFVIGINLPLDKVKLPPLYEIMSDVLARFGAQDWVFLVGDFNFNILSSNNQDVNSVINFLSHKFVPFINLPTRGTACTDHLWSNKMLELTSGIFPIPITDHMPIFITFPVVFFITEMNILSSPLETTA